MDDLEEKFAALQNKFSEQMARMQEQSAMLDQARHDQIEALTLARELLDKQADLGKSMCSEIESVRTSAVLKRRANPLLKSGLPL